jgi:predicted nucleotidyltransferase
MDVVSKQLNFDFPALHDERYPVHRIANELEPYLRAIVEKVHPDKIILFGSQAGGTPTEHSDVDLLIVRSGIVCERDSNLEIRQAFYNIHPSALSFTLLSKTPEKIAERLSAKSSFYEDIIATGVEVYAA